MKDVDLKMEKLTEKEALVMKVLWDLNQPTKPTALLEALNTTYGLSWKASTLATYLNRMVIKGAVKSEKHQYSPNISIDSYMANVACHFVNVWGKDSSRTLIDALICTLN